MGSRHGKTCHQRRQALTVSIILCSIFVVEVRGLSRVANLRRPTHLVGSKRIRHLNDSYGCFRTNHKCDSVKHHFEYSFFSTTKLELKNRGNQNSSGSSTSTQQDADSSPTTVETMEKSNSNSEWQANDFDNDRRLLEIAIARESAMSNLQQQQRKYTLEYGFARNRRPLLRDVLHTFAKVGAWMIFLASARDDSASDDSVSSLLRDSWDRSLPLNLRKLHMLIVKTIFMLTTLHHWIVGMALPLLLLMMVKCGTLGPDEYSLDEYSSYKPGPIPSNANPFFSSSSDVSNQRARNKYTGNFVLCLLENWSSAIVLSFVMRLYSMIVSLRTQKKGVGSIGSMYSLTRLFTRIGAAAALHQYPSLLFELRRGDRPRPICRSSAYMKRADKVLFQWLPLGIASDLVILLGRQGSSSGKVELGIIAASFVSTLPSLCHLIALGRIVRISKCSAVSLSALTVFPHSVDKVEEDVSLIDNHRKLVKWRYQLRWRTPQRLLETIRTWRNYFFTGHVPLLLEMDEWKKQPIHFDDFSTEGTQYKFRELLSGRVTTKMRSDENKNDNCMPDIAESLSLIFRDRDAGIRNATQARLFKHQESYTTKILDDVLGVAVQQTFGVGLSYDFDHFNIPVDDRKISVHQLRARMAKSAIRRKLELDNAMKTELDTLCRLKNFAITPLDKEVAENEMKSVEQGIRERYANEVDRMTSALCNLIPTNADAPKGTRYDSPILIAQYVDLKAAATRRGEFTVSKEVGPDPISVIEDNIRKDFGDEAADAYRRGEIAARQKETEMVSEFRRRYGEVEDGKTL